MDEEEDEEGKKKRSEVFELRDKMIFNEDLKFYTDQKIIMARVNNNTLFLLCYSQNKMQTFFHSPSQLVSIDSTFILKYSVWFSLEYLVFYISSGFKTKLHPS